MKYTITVTWMDGKEETFSDVDGYFLQLPKDGLGSYIVVQWGPQPMTRWRQWALSEARSMSIEPDEPEPKGKTIQ